MNVWNGRAFSFSVPFAFASFSPREQVVLQPVLFIIKKKKKLSQNSRTKVKCTNMYGFELLIVVSGRVGV